MSNTLNGVEDLKDITSRSKENVSIVVLEFEYGTDIDEACKLGGFTPYVELKWVEGEGVRKTIKALHDFGFDGNYVLTRQTRSTSQVCGMLS